MAISTIGTDALASAAVTSAKLASGGVTQASLATGVATTGPTFSARSASNQTLGASAWTKIICGAENWDTASCFDTSLSRFTPNVAGYYLVTGNVEFNAGSSAWVMCSPYKNGSSYTNGSNYPQSVSAGPTSVFSTLIYMNGTTDYLEMYAGMSAGGTAYSGSNTTFTAFLARAA